MSGYARIQDVLATFDSEEDSAPFFDQQGNYFSIVSGTGDSQGLVDEDVKSEEESIVWIAKGVEKKFDYKFKWVAGVPLAFSPPPSLQSKWSWALTWSFYKQRFVTLKEKCNRNFELTDDVSPMTLWLLHLYFAAKHKGSCHLLGITIEEIEPKHPLRVSFGKRRHYQTMRTGWNGSRPYRLSDFDETACNVIPESWAANLLRGNKPRMHIALVFEFLTAAGGLKGRAKRYIGEYKCLTMDDNEDTAGPSVQEAPVRSVGDKNEVLRPVETIGESHAQHHPSERDPVLSEVYRELKGRIDISRITPQTGDIATLFRNYIQSPFNSRAEAQILVDLLRAVIAPSDDSLWETTESAE